MRAAGDLEPRREGHARIGAALEALDEAELRDAVLAAPAGSQGE